MSHTVEKKRKDFEEILIEAVKEQFQREYLESDFYKYEVELQNIKFVTIMSDQELELSAKLTLDLLAELKKMNDKGFNAVKLNEIVLAAREKHENNDVMRVWKISRDICALGTIPGIIEQLHEVRRVGGAYARLISDPLLMNAVYVICEKLIDHFDNDALCRQAAFFLLRAIMKMHSDESHD